MTSNRGWIGVDLDGTLAEYHGWHEAHIGKPVPLMVERVRRWLAEGIDVRVFTARVGNGSATDNVGVVRLIQDWTLAHIGRRLQVTCRKDFGMVELWADRCVQVEPNTGRRVDGKE